MKYFVATFGCAANTADSERISAAYEAKGFSKAKSPEEAHEVIIVTCMIRESAENRVYGLVRNLTQPKADRPLDEKLKIIITGCMTGMAIRDKTGKMLANLKKRMPEVDEFLAIDEVGFSTYQLREDKKHALVLISNGCNNYCSYCVVPYSRGSEVSRPINDIITECKECVDSGHTSITLVGQNVNSYGADLITRAKSKEQRANMKITYVKHLGRLRIPTLFPYLLNEICKIKGIKKLDFISSNPWDFSDELINVIAKNKVISRAIHLPVQSGDREVLKKMNRWYSPEQYLKLIHKIRRHIPDATFSTDIIVGFCGETEKQFQHTVDLCKKIGFTKAYVSIYSDRPMTVAHKTMTDDIPYVEKKRRWEILDEMINKTNLRKGTYK